MPNLNRADPGAILGVGITRVHRGHPFQLVLGEQRDEAREPRAGDDDIGGGKREREPFGRGAGVAVGMGFERVVAELRHRKTDARARVGPELDEGDGVHDLMERGGVFFRLGFFGREEIAEVRRGFFGCELFAESVHVFLVEKSDPHPAGLRLARRVRPLPERRDVHRHLLPGPSRRGHV